MGFGSLIGAAMLATSAMGIATAAGFGSQAYDTSAAVRLDTVGTDLVSLAQRTLGPAVVVVGDGHSVDFTLAKSPTPHPGLQTLLGDLGVSDTAAARVLGDAGGSVVGVGSTVTWSTHGDGSVAVSIQTR